MLSTTAPNNDLDLSTVVIQVLQGHERRVEVSAGCHNGRVRNTDTTRYGTTLESCKGI